MLLLIYSNICPLLFQEDNDELYLEPTAGRWYRTSQELAVMLIVMIRHQQSFKNVI